MSELQYWVWLSMRSAVRPEVKNALLQHCDGARTLYFARREDLAGLGVRLRPSEERALLDKDTTAAETALRIAEALQKLQHPVKSEVDRKEPDRIQPFEIHRNGSPQ